MLFDNTHEFSITLNGKLSGLNSPVSVLFKVKNLFVIDSCTAILKTPMKCLVDFSPIVTGSVF